VLKNEKQALLNLGNLPKVGAVNAKTLIGYCGSAEAVFNEKKSALIKIPGISEHIASTILKSKSNEIVQKELGFMESNKINILPFYQNEYPKRLKQLIDSPLYLFTKGTMDFNQARVISIIGTRKNTAYGKEMTEQLIQGLKSHDIQIVSGLAYGIDGIAHKKANELSIANAAVLAHGLDLIYPKRHINLSQEILRKGGALITEHLSNTKMHPDLFPRRNRIVAGMCDACLVIESGTKGGSMITARISSKYNRTVFALPGRKGDTMSIGCNELIKKRKAFLCESADDLAHIMGWTEKKMPSSSQTSLFKELSTDEHHVVELLQSRKLSYDELLVLSQIPMNKFTTLLIKLEMEGVIQSLPGKVYGLRAA